MKKLPLLLSAFFTASLLSTSTVADPSPAATEPIVMPNTPSGAGNPNTIVCRAPQRIAVSGQFGPKVCGHNYEWLRLAMNGKDFVPDGKTLIDRATAGYPFTTTAAAASGATHPKTGLALACILGIAPNGCDKFFVGGAERVFQRVVWRGGPDPYFRGAQYVKLNDAGDEVWDMKFMHSELTYVISPPDRDGKIHGLAILQGAPNSRCDNALNGLFNLGHFNASCGVLADGFR